MKKKWFALFTTILVLLFFLSGCISNKKYKELVNENRRIVTESEDLRVDLSWALKRIAELESEITERMMVSGELTALKEQELTMEKKMHDELLSGLEEEVKAGKIEIEQMRSKLSMAVAEALFFETGEADIKPEGEAVLRRIGRILKGIPEKNIRIEGHTDNIPIGSALREKYPTNWELGAARAVNVVRFLQNKAGIDPLRLSAVSYAQYRPVASNRTKVGRAKNRRIEIILIDRNLDLAKKMKQDLEL